MPTGVYERTKAHREKISKSQKEFHKNNPYVIGFKKGQSLFPEYQFKKGHPKPKKAYAFEKGKNNPVWKGGKYKAKDYVYILKPEHPFCNKIGYVKRSRFVMEKMIGRYLAPEEVVHHRGTKYPLGSIKNRQDDRPKNLQLFPNHSEHMKFHHSLTSNF